MSYYLAIDIGASSGRHILGHVEEGRLYLEEVYRFDNEIINDGGLLSWDVEKLFFEVKEGLRACKRLGKLPKTVAIDTWGVDYVLLDGDGKEILPVVCYRDGRTETSAREVGEILSQEYLYSVTGIQKQNFNTLYQLYSDKQSGRLEEAKHFLMIPDYLSYRLTGVMKNEYTNATTTNLVGAEEKTWNSKILSTLGISSDLFKPLSTPCERVGGFTDAVASDVGFYADVILCPSHDTASAVAACPIDDETVYISSGTWSLIGTEILSPKLSQDAMTANFTNEGGIEYRFRFLKNIMGMWLFQSIRKEVCPDTSYDEMMRLAMSSDFTERIDPNAPEFLAPRSMTEAVRSYLGSPELPFADVLSSLYHSLAASYARAIEEIEGITGKKITKIFIVGGGSRDEYLNRLTARYTKRRVLTGAKEGTAVGNVASQIMADKGIGLSEVRNIIKNTFEIREF